MFIWSAGYFTVVHFPEEDVTVLWDRKTTIHIQVGPRWQVQHCFVQQSLLNEILLKERNEFFFFLCVQRIFYQSSLVLCAATRGQMLYCNSSAALNMWHSFKLKEALLMRAGEASWTLWEL